MLGKRTSRDHPGVLAGPHVEDLQEAGARDRAGFRRWEAVEDRVSGSGDPHAPVDVRLPDVPLDAEDLDACQTREEGGVVGLRVDAVSHDDEDAAAVGAVALELIEDGIGQAGDVQEDDGVGDRDHPGKARVLGIRRLDLEELAGP